LRFCKKPWKHTTRNKKRRIIEKNVSLKSYNTFGIDVRADWLAVIESEEQLLTILDDLPGMPKLILGGGSNVLFLNDFRGLILLNRIKGKKIIRETDKDIIVRVKAGENWHELVMWAVENNYGGIENLALIPGNAGTAPVQNIGAYGREIKDVLEQVTAIDMKTGKRTVFSNRDCAFGYRHSIFKEPENKGRYYITEIDLRLTKPPHPLYTEYGSLRKKLQEKNITSPTIKSIAEAVIEIRRSKLPDPAKIGNAGSFFKNPVISENKFRHLISRYHGMPHYRLNENRVKIPAGWLIEKAGLKGYREGDAGVHEKQALVLVNYGNATGQQIFDLSEKIIRIVREKFDILLQREVNIVP